jgi:hypothetical protein
MPNNKIYVTTPIYNAYDVDIKAGEIVEERNSCFMVKFEAHTMLISKEHVYATMQDAKTALQKNMVEYVKVLNKRCNRCMEMED